MVYKLLFSNAFRRYRAEDARFSDSRSSFDKQLESFNSVTSIGRSSENGSIFLFINALETGKYSLDFSSIGSKKIFFFDRFKTLFSACNEN